MPPSGNPGYFELRIYHYSNSSQEASIDSFYDSQFLPYAHSKGINRVGVFKSIANDTAADKKMYVLIPYSSLKQWEKLSMSLRTNAGNEGGFINAPYNSPAFARMENLFLKAFDLMPPMNDFKTHRT